MPEQKKQGFVARLDGTKFAREHEEIWKFVKFAGVSIISAAAELIAQLVAIQIFKALQVESLLGFF